MSRALKLEQTEAISTLAAGFTGRVTNRLLENPDISGVGSYEKKL